jgi:hypothetical protein
MDGRTLTKSGGASGERVSIDGLAEVLSNLKRLGIEADDLKELNFEAGTIVKRKVRIPTDTGEMAKTLRVARAVRAAKITVGQKNKGWYSTFVSYGTTPSKKRNFGTKANPFLLEAKKESLEEIYTHYENGIDSLIRKYNLGD